MKRSIRPIEDIFSIISLILFSQGFYPIIIGNTVDKGDVDSVLLRVIFVFIYLVTVTLLAFRWQVTWYFLRSNLWLLFLIALAIVSITWSSIPHVAFRKVIALLGSTLFGIYLGSRYTFKQQLIIYGWVFGISMFFSYLFVVVSH